MILEIISWSAAMGYLLGYYLLNANKISLYLFNVITLITSLVYVYYGFVKTAYPSATINIVFVVITSVYLIKHHGSYKN